MMMMLPSSSSLSSSTPSSSSTSSPSSMIASPGGSSVSKRLAKRSILGTRVVAPGDDGKLYPGIIQAMKTCEDRLGQNRYSVKFDDTRRVKEFRETEIVGPGFQNVTSSKLRSGQIVYVTHCNREMQGAVVHHRPNIDQVIIQLLNGGPEVKKKLEEVRLLESRKSARLIGHGANTDFSKLADFNIVHERKRLNSETNSDISGASCRKRRGSETLSDSSGDEFHSGLWSSCSDDRSTTPIMSECTAAMVLMNLSYSPRWLQMAPANPMGNHPESANHENRDSRMTTPCSSPVNMTMAASAASPLTTHFSDLASVAANVMIDGSVSPSSSGISSLGSSWTSTPNLTEAEALLQLSNQESDEGIVSDQSSSADPYDDANKRLKTEHSQIIYKCTWRRCETAMNTQGEIERHIRQHHLKKPDPKSEEERDHEEDFYYEEIQVPFSSQLILKCGSPSAVRPSQFPLVHHGTNPATSHRVQCQASSGRAITVSSKIGGRPIHVLADHIDMARPPHENPEYKQLRGGLLAQGTNVTFIQHPSSQHHRHHLQQQQQPQQPQPYPSVPNVIPGSPLALVSNGIVSTSTATSMRPPVSSSSPSIASNYNGSKLLRLSPKPTNPVPKSPIRRPRGDTKKCRKVYGMDQKESWCTQCKWKKACSRFSELST